MGERTADAHALVLRRARLREPLEAEVMAGLLEDILNIIHDIFRGFVGVELIPIHMGRQAGRHREERNVNESNLHCAGWYGVGGTAPCDGRRR